MKYRISYYRKAEVDRGRAPRIFVDITADTKALALKAVFPNGYVDWHNHSTAKATDCVLRSIYNAPSRPLAEKPSYVFEYPEALDEWYRAHKDGEPQKRYGVPLTPRLCKKCSKNEVEHYQRLCEECKKTHKFCADCGVEISTRRHFCDTCLSVHETEQENLRRKKRRTRMVLTRLAEQVKTAEELLLTNPRAACVNAAKYQGLRFPHANKEKETCRMCLEKFIETQKVYRENILSGKMDNLIIEPNISVAESVAAV